MMYFLIELRFLRTRIDRIGPKCTEESDIEFERTFKYLMHRMDRTNNVRKTHMQTI